MRRLSLISTVPGRLFWSAALILSVFAFSRDSIAQNFPDLVIDNMVAMPSTWVSGESVYFEAEVSNNGGSDSYGTFADFYLSSDATISTDDQAFGYDMVRALDGGESTLAMLDAVVTPAPGNYWVGACHRGVPNETNTNNNCSEGFPVTVESGGGAFPINAGLNDAWYDPDTAGQGFFITVFEDHETIFLAWFTYDTERPPENAEATLGEPGHRWLTAYGPYSGDIADLDIELTSGGVFNAAQPSPNQEIDGTISVEFHGCNSATVTYDVFSAGLAGQIGIERIALDNVPACESQATR